MLRSLFLSLTLLVIMGAPDLPAQTLSSPHPAYIPVERFDPARDAEKDIRDAVAEAQRSSRRVLLDVGGTGAFGAGGWIPSLRAATTSGTPRCGFVTVKVNWSKENKNERCSRTTPPFRIPSSLRAQSGREAPPFPGHQRVGERKGA